ncbi:MAG: rRNA maturation RNase YbeY [Actinobacteria bacterium]|nr:rRNA maturation RNase YbeY [Actinomycetota bacterium]
MAAPVRDVFVADEQAQVDVDAVRCAALAAHVLDVERVRREAELSLMFVDEETIADLHLRFLGLEGPTDVLAFPMDEELVESGRQPDQGGRGPGAAPEATDAPVVVGDVVVCPTVAERQAHEHGRTLEEEIDLLVVHGVLHLLDYDHVDDEEATTMRRRERELLDGFHFGDAG